MKKQEHTINDVLNDIQCRLNAPKTEYNAFGKYKYRSLENILEGLKEFQSKYGCTITLSDDISVHGDRVYVKATATLSYNGESISVTGYARESLTKKGMDDSQITGSSSTYARKYAMNGLFAIDDSIKAEPISADATYEVDSQPPKKENKNQNVKEKSENKAKKLKSALKDASKNDSKAKKELSDGELFTKIGQLCKKTKDNGLLTDEEESKIHDWLAGKPTRKGALATISKLEDKLSKIEKGELPF